MISLFSIFSSFTYAQYLQAAPSSKISTSSDLSPGNLSSTLPPRGRPQGSWVVLPRCFTPSEFPSNAPVNPRAFDSLLDQLAAKPRHQLDELLHYRASVRDVAGRYRRGRCYVALDRSRGPFRIGGPVWLPTPDYDDYISWTEIVRIARRVHELCDVRPSRRGSQDMPRPSAPEGGFGGQDAVGNGHGYAVRIGCYDY